MEGQPPFPDHKEKGGISYIRIFSGIILAFSFLLFLISLSFLFSPVYTGYSNLGGLVYFFVLLYLAIVGYLPVIILVGAMVALYFIFFIIMMRSSIQNKSRSFDNPAVYFALVSSAVLIIELIATIAEEKLGIGIGGGSIDTSIVTNPFLTYVSLIYAPFAEEVGFRIIPIGLFVFFMIYRRSGNIKDSLYGILAPGRMLRKNDISIKTWPFIVMVLATSAVWGYAHVYYGAWDPGKIIPVFIAGIAIAFGYLKFGVYMDILMHWFYNGTLTLVDVYPLTGGIVDTYLIVILIAGVIGIVMLILRFAGFIGGRTSIPEI